MLLNLGIYDFINQDHIRNFKHEYKSNSDIYIIFNIDKCNDKAILDHVYSYDIFTTLLSQGVMAIVNKCPENIIRNHKIDIIDIRNMSFTIDIDNLNFRIVNTTGDYPIIDDDKYINLIRIEDTQIFICTSYLSNNGKVILKNHSSYNIEISYEK